MELAGLFKYNLASIGWVAALRRICGRWRSGLELAPSTECSCGIRAEKQDSKHGDWQWAKTNNGWREDLRVSYAQPQGNSNRRLTGLVVVVVFHAVMGYALVNGLARKIVEVVTQPLDTKIIEEIKPPPQEKPPPPPPPRLAAPPPPYIPPPEVQVQVPQMAPAITAVTSIKPTGPVAPPGQRTEAPPAPITRAAPVRTSAVVDARACEKPEYPPAALRAQETGIVLLAFLIDVNGTALESKVERSSGFRRLDEAARKALGLCKFKPATVDGKPERAWAKMEYEWKID
jgi:periplasmic protein TonB